MTGFSDADTAAFFDTTLWALEATVNGAFTVSGILDEVYVDPLGIAATAPVFTCAVAAWETSLPGDVLDVGERRWVVDTVEPDGNGIQALRLRKVD